VGAEIIRPETSQLQFTGWAFAFAPKHPILSSTIGLICEKVKEMKASPSSADAVEITGPAVYSRAVTNYMTKRGLSKETVMAGGDHRAGDVSIFGINRFAPLQDHSNATQDCHHPDIFLIHQFAGRWRASYQWYTADGKPPKGAWLPAEKPSSWVPRRWEDYPQ